MAPLALGRDDAAGELRLRWPEGEQRLAYAALRASCPCAFCRAQRWQGRQVSVAAGIRVVALTSFGYGVQLAFSDGHDRGIYPWTYLRDLAPAPGPLLRPPSGTGASRPVSGAAPAT